MRRLIDCSSLMATFQNFKLSATSPHQNTGYYSISGANGSTYVSGQGKIIKSINGGNSWNELLNSPGDIFAIHGMALRK